MADDDSVESAYDLENLFIAATDADHPKPPKVGEDLRQLHKEWAQCALASMKAKSYDKAEWKSCFDSIADPKLEDHAKRARTLYSKQKSSKVHYDKNKDKVLETRKLIKTLSSSNQDYVVIDIDMPKVTAVAAVSESSPALDSSPGVDSSPAVDSSSTADSSPGVDSNPAVDSSSAADSSAKCSSSVVDSTVMAPAGIIGMTATIKSIPQSTEKKRKRTRKHKDSL